MDESGDGHEPTRGPDALRQTRLQGWDAVRARFGELGVLAPLAVALVGVGLDRAGYSAVGVTLTFLGGAAFVVMLYLLARWG
jgi:hypothetical protein